MTEGSSAPADTRLALPDVTLVAVSSIAITATLRALEISMRLCRFGGVLFLSDQPPCPDSGGGEPSIEWRRIAPIRSRLEYSQFMLQQLHAHVSTSHALCVQWDGYVLNPRMWDGAFLDYDYIGAPWPHFADGMDVGNGGFSLRSQRLMRATASLNIASDDVEDVAICRTHRRNLEEEHGLRFAPTDLAHRFAYERYPASDKTFGFHGVYNLAELVRRQELKSILRAIEPHVMAPSELRELLGWACRRFDPGLALLLARRMRERGRLKGERPRI